MISALPQRVSLVEGGAMAGFPVAPTAEPGVLLCISQPNSGLSTLGGLTLICVISSGITVNQYN